MQNNLLKIINHYGVLNQLKYFQSEVFELNEAIIKFENSTKENTDEEYIKGLMDIAEEIADVLVMLLQFKEYYAVLDDMVELIMKKKINRQVERIKSE